MDLKLIKAFVGVAEHRTVSKAAEAAHITQPALSRQLQSLEHAAGFKLFERTGRNLALTPRGEQFLAECRALLTHASAFDQRTRELRRGDLQVLRVAAPALTIEALFPQFLKRYVRDPSAICLQLIDAEAADHLAMLERGEADVSVNVINMLPVDERHFSSRLLWRFEMLAACAPGHPFARASSAADIATLAEYALLLLDRSYATRHVFDAACRLSDIKPRMVFESRSVNTLLAMAEAGHGVALIPSALRTDPKRIATRPVTHRQKPLELNLALIWDKRRLPERHGEHFSRQLVEYMEDTYPAPATRTPRVKRTAVAD